MSSARLAVIHEEQVVIDGDGDGVLADLLESDGPIASRTAGINRSIKDIGQQRSELGQRLVMIEARYRAQFSALDTLVSRLNSTSNFLTQQLASLANLSNSSLK